MITQTQTDCYQMRSKFVDEVTDSLPDRFLIVAWRRPLATDMSPVVLGVLFAFATLLLRLYAVLPHGSPTKKGARRSQSDHCRLGVFLGSGDFSREKKSHNGSLTSRRRWTYH